MADTIIVAGGAANPSLAMVSADQETILGNGTTEDPLRAVVQIGSGVIVEDEGLPISGNPHTTLNFAGSGVITSDVDGVATIAITGDVTVWDEGSPIVGNPHPVINFVGAGVTAANVAGVATVTVPGGSSGVALQDEGAPVTGNPHSTINFVGAGVTATDVAGVGTITVPGGIAVQDEGAPVTGNPHATVNFVGSGVTATDVAGVATITIPGGSSGIALQDEGNPVTGNPHSTVNFVGAGVTATDVAGVGTITVPGGIAVQDEGAPVTGNPHATVNFVGAGVTATDAAGVATVTIPGGIAGIAVQDEGAPVTGNPHATVNFVGSGVTATDVAGVATITIPGGGGIALQDEGSPVTGNPHSTVNFVGAGVTATDVAGVGTITVPGGGTVPGQLMLGGIVSDAITGPNNDYNPAGLANAAWLRLTPSFSPSLGGIVAQPNAVLWITNVGGPATPMTLTHEDGGSAPANRFFLIGLTTWFMPEDSTIQLIYDVAISRWRIFGLGTGCFPQNNAGGTSPVFLIGNPFSRIGISGGANMILWRNSPQLQIDADTVRPATNLQISGAGGATQIFNNLEIAAVSAPTLSADANDWNAFGADNNVVRVSQGAPGFSVTGLAGGVSGLSRWIVNVSAFPLTLLDANVGSGPGNRFSLPAPTLVIAPKDSQQVWYDVTDAVWRPF